MDVIEIVNVLVLKRKIVMSIKIEKVQEIFKD